MVERMRGLKQMFFPNLERVLRVVELAATYIMAPIREMSPYYDRADNRKGRRWCIEGVDWREALGTMDAELAKIEASGGAATEPTLRVVRHHVRSVVSAWSHFETLDPESKCFVLSSYCYGLALLCEDRNELGRGLLMLHRALDLFLQYLGLTCGLRDDY